MVHNRACLCKTPSSRSRRIARRSSSDVARADDGVGLVVARFMGVRFPAFSDAVRDLRRAGGDGDAAARDAVDHLALQPVPAPRFSLYLIARGFFQDHLTDGAR